MPLVSSARRLPGVGEYGFYSLLLIMVAYNSAAFSKVKVVTQKKNTDQFLLGGQMVKFIKMPQNGRRVFISNAVKGDFFTLKHIHDVKVKPFFFIYSLPVAVLHFEEAFVHCSKKMHKL